MHRVIHIHPEAAPKPAQGEPCNGCGVCCLTEPCPVGMLVSRKRRGACAALRWDGETGRYRCGVVSEPQRHTAPRWLAAMAARWAMRMIAAGQGCDCDLTVEAAQP
ncbi:MAG TPA: hypothetical protein VFL64_14750 [Rhizobacter sp.]|nr:hypothetical protein [Rhizobacter sp.]